MASKMNHVWTLIMHYVYEENYHILMHECVASELGDGEGCFEGRDVEKGIW
jgi:hypothetical protein